ncbi:MAG TPA: hypothetical protein DDW52_25795 [Planctomycetaceae bacterium]|nr:hypothetical protein [Planctomycetaceae bacterium]
MLLLAPILLISLCLLPNNSANRGPKQLAALVSFCLALVLADLVLHSALWLTQPGGYSGSLLEAVLGNTPGVYVDGLAGTMAVLIGFIGWIIIRYSVPYLEGDPQHGRFIKWLGFTLGSVLLMVLSSNLVILAGAWMLISLGLHKLLTHYPHRKAGRIAAMKKFAYSRLGDAFVISAIVLIYLSYGTLSYDQLFQQTSANPQAGWMGSAIAILLALGALTKSAQFPFHTWLPDTMETPTPVSALMHAGIINGGGFLLIRLSPLVSVSSAALNSLTIVGAFTAVLAAVVMLCQTSVKRKLAYSTVAQMGFMIMQCGLGAFAAALLHIVAHSLYKSYAFLSAGGVAAEIARPSELRPQTATNYSAIGRLVSSGLAGCIVGGLITGATFWLTGLLDKFAVQTVLLPLALSLALAHFIASAVYSAKAAVIIRTVGLGMLAGLAYCVSYLLFDSILHAGGASSGAVAVTSPIVIGLVCVTLVATAAVFGLMPIIRKSQKMRNLYIHASSGFYVDVVMARLTQRLLPRPALATVSTTYAQSTTSTWENLCG